jgi:hypothetical protein
MAQPDDASAQSWTRDFWRPGGGDAFLFYAVFGKLPPSFDVPAQKYRTRGLPSGVEVRHFSRSRNADYIAGLTEGYAWEELSERDPSLAAKVAAAEDCLVVAGTVSDPDSLRYLRDTIGFVTYLLDASGVALLDLQTWWWYSPSRWHEQIFDADVFDPYRHVVILISPQDDASGRFWFHTRGMRKFGRPDISVHDVAAHEQDTVARFCNALIAHQASGGIIGEEQRIRMTNPDWIGIAHHAGDVDDLNFNNVHIEVTPVPAA